MLSNPLPLRRTQIDTLLRLVAEGECCAIFGLSNTGKSPLLRALAAPPHIARYEQLTGRPGALIYVDCNRVVELTAPGFYEIVVRSLLEALTEANEAPARLLQRLHDQHNRLTTAASAFQASLAFTQAISECCQELRRDLVLLLDEFDEVYAALEGRALLNLRALKDKFQARLTYITATVRPLNESRPSGEDEFAELFAAHTLPLGLLSSEDARQVIAGSGGASLSPGQVEEILRLAGGHFGLLGVLTQAAHRQAEDLAAAPNARAECLKIWNQLRPEEQTALKSLVTEAEEGLNPHDRERLQNLGLLTAEGGLFSPLFTHFVRRQSAAPAQAAVGVLVDEDAGEVWVEGVKVTVLTDLEYKLVRLLAQRLDRLTTKDMIVEAVWGGQYFDKVDDARIEKLVSRLRAKIEPDPAHPRYLLTQRGRGYKLAGHPAPSKDENEV
jgi:DNA-binding winged helix-turn-helix (wHTH) protein/GTP-binding protein EngB required for normal cell division